VSAIGGSIPRPDRPDLLRVVRFLPFVTEHAIAGEV